MKMIEKTTLERIRANLEAVLYKNGFSQCEIHGKTNYKYGDEYCKLSTMGATEERTFLLIEYADSLEEANKNFYDDGDSFLYLPYEFGEEVILKQLVDEIFYEFDIDNAQEKRKQQLLEWEREKAEREAKQNKALRWFLSWKRPHFLNKIAINHIVRTGKPDLSALSRDIYGKECWFSIAEIICKTGYPKNEKAMPALFEWLQDINWPGALDVWNFLIALNTPVFVRHCEAAIEQAKRDDDLIWLEFISSLVNEKGLAESDFSSPEIFRFINEVFENYIAD
jgi:hypothetical protein